MIHLDIFKLHKLNGPCHVNLSLDKSYTGKMVSDTNLFKYELLDLLEILLKKY